MESERSIEEVLDSLRSQSENSTEISDFLNQVVEELASVLTIDAIVAVARFDKDTFEVTGLFNRSYAQLDQNRFLKIHRRTPMTEAINSCKIQIFGSHKVILREFPESSNWPVIPRAIVAVPVVVDGITEAGCVFALHDEFSKSENERVAELFQGITNLAYLLYLAKK